MQIAAMERILSPPKLVDCSTLYGLHIPITEGVSPPQIALYNARVAAFHGYFREQMEKGAFDALKKK